MESNTDGVDQGGGMSSAVPPGVRDALSEVIGESKQLAAGHLELRMLELRALVEGYAKRTSAACTAVVLAACGLACITVAAVLALHQRGFAPDQACATVGGTLFVVTWLLMRGARKPVEVPSPKSGGAS